MSGSQHEVRLTVNDVPETPDDPWQDRLRIQASSLYVPHGIQELRISYNGGGPGWMEAIIHVDEFAATLTVWNPFRHEWAKLNLEGLGDTRR